MAKPRRLTTKERAGRQRIMMRLRRWLEKREIPRRDVAAELGITVGHLSTLINANRSASEDQCQKALVLMDAKFAVSKHDPRYEELGVKPLLKRKEKRPEPRPKRKAKKKPKTSKLRSLTKAEAKFISEVAQAWIKDNKGASQNELVDVVRALSIGIRT